jgi:NAD(P)-dependent dehydrogenase (short-subunit alcohol dehydrogenase family)
VAFAARGDCALYARQMSGTATARYSLLAGKVALVTGASGASRAAALADAGAAVVLAAGPDSVAEVGTDVLVERDEAALEAALERFGRLDVLVNDAPLAPPVERQAHEVSEREWELALDLGIDAVWRRCRAVVPALVRSGGGAIVNVSPASAGAAISFSAHGLAAEAVVGFTKALAVEYGEHGIRANVVRPVRRAETAPADVRLEEMVSRACAFLASDAAARITGSVLVVDPQAATA